jgi:hypothetical protein
MDLTSRQAGSLSLRCDLVANRDLEDVSMPRYVILEHDWPDTHWDFMLEVGTVLPTWKLADVPKPGVVISAEKSFDHRLMYLDYEGPISGSRGSVSRWDAGSYEPLVDEQDRRVLKLDGQRLHGIVELKNDPAAGWSFSWQQE